MTETDQLAVEQTLRIEASPETVWRYWTDPARMCDWWGVRAELDPQPGGNCRVELENGGTMRGEYLELDPFERIVFSFGWEVAEGGPRRGPRIQSRRGPPLPRRRRHDPHASAHGPARREHRRSP